MESSCMANMVLSISLVVGALGVIATVVHMTVSTEPDIGKRGNIPGQKRLSQDLVIASALRRAHGPHP